MELEKMFLSQKDVEFIHEQSVKLLNETGCIFEDDRAIEILKAHGASVDGYTVHFTEKMINEALQTVSQEFDILRPDGSYHCYNVVEGHTFDLTSEQFAGEALRYRDNPTQQREEHFAKEEKRLRYELLKKRLLEKCREPSSESLSPEG